MNWIVKIEKLKYPNLLVDVALKSPFLIGNIAIYLLKKVICVN